MQLINFRYDPYKQPAVAGVKNLRGNYAVTEFRINNQVIPYSPLDTVRWQEATFENWTTLTFRQNKPNALDLSNGGGDPQRDVNRTFEIAGVGGGQRAFHYYADEVNNVLYLEDKYKAIPDRRNIAAGVGGDGGTARNLAAAGNLAITGQSINKPKKSTDTASWIPREALANIEDELYKIDKIAFSTRRVREYNTAPKNEKRNHLVLKYYTQDGNQVILSGINEK